MTQASQDGSEDPIQSGWHSFFSAANANSIPGDAADAAKKALSEKIFLAWYGALGGRRCSAIIGTGSRVIQKLVHLLLDLNVVVEDLEVVDGG